MAVSAAFSGAALFAYYRFELDDTRERVAELEGQIADDLATAAQVIGQRTEDANAEIDRLLQEVEQSAAARPTGVSSHATLAERTGRQAGIRTCWTWGTSIYSKK